MNIKKLEKGQIYFIEGATEEEANHIEKAGRELDLDVKIVFLNTVLKKDDFEIINDEYLPPPEVLSKSGSIDWSMVAFLSITLNIAFVAIMIREGVLF